MVRFSHFLSCALAVSAASSAAAQALVSGSSVPSASPVVEERPTDVRPVERPLLSPEMRGDIFMARKRYRDAVDLYRQGPTDSPVLANKIGIAFHQMLVLDAAKRQYEQAVKLDPRYPEAHNNLGTVYYARKSYRRAIGQYKRALRLAPQSASVLSNLGTAYFARKKYEQAVDCYQQALALDPDVFEHRSTHGVLLQERSVEERAKFHYTLAKMYAKTGASERALLYVRKALEEGFADRDKFREEPEFAALRQMPEFQELLASEPRVL